MCARLKRLRSRVSTYKFSELVMHKKLKVLTKVKETLSSVMAEATVRQDQQSLFYNLKVAQQKGYLIYMSQCNSQTDPPQRGSEFLT